MLSDPPPDGVPASNDKELAPMAILNPVPIVQVPTLILSLLYLGVAIVIIIQIGMNIHFRDSLISFNFAFSCLCLIWSCLRFMLFVVLGWWLQQSDIVVYLIYWVPVNFQFVIFSLLVIFYIYVLYRSSWTRRTKKVVIFAFVGINVLLLAGLVACILVKHKGENWADTLRAMCGFFLSKAPRFFLTTSHPRFTIVLFAILSVMLGVFGWRVKRILSQTRRPPPQLRGITPRKVAVITIASVVIFISRCIYQVVSLILDWALLFTNESWNDLLTAACYFVWEIVPTIMVVVLFWRRGGGGNDEDIQRILPVKLGGTYPEDSTQHPYYTTPFITPPKGVRYSALTDDDSTSLFPSSKGLSPAESYRGYNSLYM